MTPWIFPKHDRNWLLFMSRSFIYISFLQYWFQQWEVPFTRFRISRNQHASSCRIRFRNVLHLRPSIFLLIFLATSVNSEVPIWVLYPFWVMFKFSKVLNSTTTGNSHFSLLITLMSAVWCSALMCQSTSNVRHAHYIHDTVIGFHVCSNFPLWFSCIRL
jgi:hypothetical protein